MSYLANLAIDIETYSDIDITKAGVYPYVESPAFLILLFAYRFNNEEVKIIDLTAEPLPKDIIKALSDPTVIKTAYNANFERVCLSKHLNTTLPIDQWRCTALQASLLGYPNNLKGVAEILNLEHRKDAKGTRLINYFSKPNKQNTRNTSETNPAKWEEFKDYCLQDVRVETAIREHLKDYPIPQSEQELYIIDQIINDRGIKVNTTLINNAMKFDKIHATKCTEEFKQLTNGINPKSVKQLREYLQENNIFVDSVDKKALEALRGSVSDEKLKKVLTLKAQLSKTSIAKYRAMKGSTCKDSRIRGLLQFYGANRTGRWAGRLVQVHNLPQNHLAHIEQVREIVIKDDYELLDMLYNNIPTVLSQLIRTAFIPEDGKKFIVCDFSAIEARVIAYLADEKWRLDVFNTHGKIYEASASQMFNIPLNEITKPLRQKGKVAELALGYGGSVSALKSMGALNMGLKEEELQDLVDSWRSANPNVIKFWRNVERAAKNAVKNNPSYIAKNIGFSRSLDHLFISLPSGRSLAYANPNITTNRFGSETISYYGVDGTTKQWTELETYGGKLVENIVQAVARDCLAECLKRLHTKGYRIIFHVHDEVIIECDNNTNIKEVEEVMCQSIEWAKGLKLTAAGFESLFYMKD